MAQRVKNLPAVQETWVRSLGWEDPLEEGKATHSSILAWRIPMDRGAWWAAVYGVAQSQTRLKQLSSSSMVAETVKNLPETVKNLPETVKNAGDLSSVPRLGRSPGGGQGNPLQYSCLENPHGQRNLVGHSPWGGKQSDMTE